MVAAAKRHNRAPETKALARRELLRHLAAEAVSVLDVYAGPGEMANAVWREVARLYCAVDEDRASPRAVRAKNDAFLRIAALDVCRFNVFDFDAYGAPWLPVWLVAGRLTGRSDRPARVGLVMTDGLMPAIGRRKRNLAEAGFSRQMLDALKIEPGSRPVVISSDPDGLLGYAARLVGAWFGEAGYAIKWAKCTRMVHNGNQGVATYAFVLEAA